MRIKLDENIGARGKKQLEDAGHDVSTIEEEGMCSSTDEEVAGAVQKERRCLVTLDLDFSNPLRFVPSSHSRIAVLRVGPQITTKLLSECIGTFVKALNSASIDRRLWIVEPGRYRQYEPNGSSGA